MSPDPAPPCSHSKPGPGITASRAKNKQKAAGRHQYRLSLTLCKLSATLSPASCMGVEVCHRSPASPEIPFNTELGPWPTTLGRRRCGRSLALREEPPGDASDPIAEASSGVIDRVVHLVVEAELAPLPARARRVAGAVHAHGWAEVAHGPVAI
eukprot:CAMPEP_0195068596 /NCGR_PEP_ID=MMETSP0448-20130528/13247_1 /TAXON_ID=66468 /ORGANISM="Heterocapsa triquestra, Strain CCMP 448" /LENGTH=153 /DNA_ID=CAMNT_0040100135 /DNA_START=117 /DNA_END=578 /DNA_ORIENTATION=+